MDVNAGLKKVTNDSETTMSGAPRWARSGADRLSAPRRLDTPAWQITLVAAALAIGGACTGGGSVEIDRQTQALNGTSAFPSGAPDTSRTYVSCDTATRDTISRSALRLKQLLFARRPAITECLKEAHLMGPNTKVSAYETPVSGQGVRGTSYPEWLVYRLLDDLVTNNYCATDLGTRVAEANFNPQAEVVKWASNVGSSPAFSTSRIMSTLAHELAHNKGVDHFDQVSEVTAAFGEPQASLNYLVATCVSQVLAGEYRPMPADSRFTRERQFEERTLAPVGVEQGDGRSVWCPGASFVVGLHGFTFAGQIADMGPTCRPFLGEYDQALLGGSSNSGFRTRCASGEVMVGMWGNADATITGIGALCQSEATVRAGGSAARRDPMTGHAGAVEWERKCPAGMALKGFRGRLDELVRRLELDCQRFTNGRSVTTSTPPSGFVGPNSGYEISQPLCPGRTVLNTVYVSTAGTAVTRLAGQCSDLESVGGVDRIYPFSSAPFMAGAGNVFGWVNGTQACGSDEALVGLRVNRAAGETEPLRAVAGLCAVPSSWQQGGAYRALTPTGMGNATWTTLTCQRGEYLNGWDIMSDGEVKGVRIKCRGFAFASTDMPSRPFAREAQIPYALRDDLVLTGASGWSTIPMAVSNGDGNFSVFNGSVAGFPLWATTSAAKLVGDFNMDGRKDIALVGGPGWSTIPVAFGFGSGFNITTNIQANFASWAQQAGVVKLVGDFDGDGASDLALLGPNANVPGVRVALANPSGSTASFEEKELQAVAGSDLTASQFMGLITATGAVPLVADFDGDGSSDIALTGGAGWQSIPVALFKRTGLKIRNATLGGQWGGWASTAGVTALTGEFATNTSYADIALTGASGWSNIKVAASNGDGTFTIFDGTIDTPSWGSWAAMPGMRKLPGHFTRSLDAWDIALVGATGRTTISVAHPNGDGSFSVIDFPVANFPGWAATAGAMVMAGYFDNDGYTDLAITGPSGWTTIPVAFGTGSGFRVTNQPVGGFPAWAATAGTSKLLGNFDQ